MAEREYRRLTRSKGRTFALASSSRSSLWLGKDHVLQIDASGYNESYKRFFFRDIQALVLCRTDAWLYQAVVLAAFACLFGLIAIFGGGPVLAWIFGVVTGIFVFFLVLDLILGPTAKAYLRTAVQTEKLVSLNRLRRAERVFNQLQSLILAAQAEPKRTDPPAGLPEQPSPPVIQEPPRITLDPGAEIAKPPAGETA